MIGPGPSEGDDSEEGGMKGYRSVGWGGGRALNLANSPPHQVDCPHSAGVHALLFFYSISMCGISFLLSWMTLTREHSQEQANNVSSLMLV